MYVPTVVGNVFVNKTSETTQREANGTTQSTRLVGEPVIRERDAVLVIAIDEDGEPVIRTYI